MALAVGNRVFVCYDVPGPDLYHERLVVGVCLCGQGWFIVVTPDLDRFAEQVSILNDDLRSFHVVPTGQDLPFGIAVANCYRFAALPVGDQLRQLCADGVQDALAIAIAPGAPAGAVPVALPPAAPMGALAAAGAPAGAGGGRCYSCGASNAMVLRLLPLWET